MTGKSRGFGFVRYGDRAIQAHVFGQPHTIKGRRIELKYPKQVRECGHPSNGRGWNSAQLLKYPEQVRTPSRGEGGGWNGNTVLLGYTDLKLHINVIHGFLGVH